MYQALYRKYRPSTLDDVAGQEVIVKILKNAIKNNKISHAYLFCGPRGTGKTSIAKILAKTLNCTDLQEFNPCDKCENCISFNEKNSTDIIEIDAASNNGVDEIRELKNKVNLVPNIGKYKIYIIDEVHMLTIGAFNALLKTLEEPPKHAIFILATTEVHKIPITILSRCQRLDFSKISEKNIIDRLKNICEKENIKIADDALEKIANLSDGGLRDSIGMLDKLVSYTNEKITIKDVIEINGIVTNDELQKFILDIINKDFKAVFEKIDNFNSNGKNLSKLSEQIMQYLRNLLVDDLSNKCSNEIVQKLEYEKIIKYIEQFGEILNLIKNNSNAKIIMETNIIKLMVENNDVKTVMAKEKQNVTIEEYKPREEPKEILPNEKIEKIDKLKQIRIDNTLSAFDKKELLECKQKLENIQSLLIDPDYSEESGLIIDGELKAASDAYLIFVYNSENIELNFNLKIQKLENMLSKIGINKKVVATNIDDWNIIKQEFNSKSKKYVYKDDTQLVNEIFQRKEEKNSIENMFDDIIEYSK